jgi:hypothetical protein
MEKRTFFIDASKLEYAFSNKELINHFDEDIVSCELPSVSYLTLQHENEIYIPISIFQSSLTPFQSIVKYLKEHIDLSNSKISSLINRDVKTIWATYASVKNKKTTRIDNSSLMMPLGVFREHNFSIFESVVYYLKNKNISYAEIGRLLHKDQRTIWTVHSRLKNKLMKENDEQ